MHTAYELVEQYIIEQFWPVGEPAANCRALISGTFGYKNEKIAGEVMKMLHGIFEPKEQKDEVNQQMLDQVFKNFFNAK